MYFNLKFRIHKWNRQFTFLGVFFRRGVNIFNERCTTLFINLINLNIHALTRSLYLCWYDFTLTVNLRTRHFKINYADCKTDKFCKHLQRINLVRKEIWATQLTWHMFMHQRRIRYTQCACLRLWRRTDIISNFTYLH